MKPILTLMPSRGRPKECEQAVWSFFNTSKQSDLLLLVDEDDQFLREYKKIHNCIIEKKDTITNRLNKAYKENSSYHFYHITNDDVIYRTDHWDKKFMAILEKPGIAYGDDLFQRSNLPTFPFISVELLRAIGWIQMPLLNRYCGDLIWKIIGENCNCLFYLGDVVIEHMHQLAGKGKYPVDMKVYAIDQLALSEWLQTAHQDVEKIRKVINASEFVR